MVNNLFPISPLYVYFFLTTNTTKQVQKTYC